MGITKIAIEGFRCFGKREEARLAPLTLLVGENSAGKTSFLAMVKALQDSMAMLPQPDFNAAPYEFGSYDDMAYRGGTIEEGTASEFRGSLTFTPEWREPLTSFGATYAKEGKEPAVVGRRIVLGDHWFEYDKRPPDGLVAIGSPQVEIKMPYPRGLRSEGAPHPWALLHAVQRELKKDGGQAEVVRGTLDSKGRHWSSIEGRLIRFLFDLQEAAPRTFPGAPVRSRPKRTYEATPGRNVAEGDRIPRRLADLIGKGGRAWAKLGGSLRRYGRESGMFDRIAVRRLGSFDSDPFQVSVSPSGSPDRVLTDVGYGVSQALPVLVELLNGDPSRVFLLQQPEVHLHPRAQATLGSLMARVASRGRQLLVETHSDYLLDRIRMDIRDRKTELGPDDVSILYFERAGVEAKIHSLRIDAQGNVIGAPDGYRQFFLDEVERSFGI